MIIVVGGDSMVWGSELLDCKHSGAEGYSKNTFPYLISQPHEYQCVAFPGNGNDSIARTVMNQCEKNRKLGLEQTVIVMWTFHSRYEFNFEIDHKNHWRAINSWTIGTLYDSSEDEEKNQYVLKYNQSCEKQIVDFAKSYFKHVGLSGYWQIYASIKEILYLQNYLKIHSIPYVFTCVDTILLYNYFGDHYDESITTIYNQFDMDSWFLFPPGVEPGQTTQPRGFYQWAVENKYNIGPEGHPLEDAHRDAANLFKEKFNELVKKHY